MATSIIAARIPFSTLDADRRDAVGLVLSAVLPFAVFVVFNGVAGFLGVQPMFFAPLGLPGWMGAALHLSSLPLLGVSRWMVVAHGAAGHRAGWWIVGTMVGVGLFPYLVNPLNSLMLTLVSVMLVTVGLGAMVRAGAVEPKAALVMAPAMAWLGFSAFVGLSFAAAWAPPFAVTNSQSAG